jgi:hypothetical protein
MVDPVFDPSSELLTRLKNLYYDASVQEHHLLNRIQSGDESRPLKLEAGVIPMLVLSSIDLLQDSAQATAHRHSRLRQPIWQGPNSQPANYGGSFRADKQLGRTSCNIDASPTESIRLLYLLAMFTLFLNCSRQGDHRIAIGGISNTTVHYLRSTGTVVLVYKLATPVFKRQP